jgi:Tat protein secretion system quality control protein TatD with DNase activity
MKLIDADKLQEDLEKVKKESASLVDISHIIGFQSVVDAQQTAFNVDKVVEQLEEKSITFETDFTVKENKWILTNDAIEIVKAGRLYD